MSLLLLLLQWLALANVAAVISLAYLLTFEDAVSQERFGSSVFHVGFDGWFGDEEIHVVGAVVFA